MDWCWLGWWSWHLTDNIRISISIKFFMFNILEEHQTKSGGLIVHWSRVRRNSHCHQRTLMAANSNSRTWLLSSTSKHHFCDNQSCIALTCNPKFHDRSKHIDIRYHFLRNKFLTNTLALKFTPTTHMWVDILTTALLSQMFISCINGINSVESSPTWCRGRSLIYSLCIHQIVEIPKCS
jgi:hypothetical protein